MKQQPLFVEVSHRSLNKKEEELCGDMVEVFQEGDRTLIVLADGLGSGVKANILATLTSKIAITMLKKGAELEEVIETVLHTLPVCKVRKIAYSTFSIIEINASLECRVFESENPPFFFVRDGRIMTVEKEEKIVLDKKVLMSTCKLQENDSIFLCSDGVIHAGVGKILNFGWQWEHVASYIEKDQQSHSADLMCRRLLGACRELYEDEPGDDTTVVTLKVRRPVQLLLFTGPPVDTTMDAQWVKGFMRHPGKKIVCGGTAAHIVSRELNRPIHTNLDYLDPNIPPTARIKGVDLVTEGVLTLQKTIRMIYDYGGNKLDHETIGEDGAGQLFKALVFEGTHIELWVGKAMNRAHQQPDFPRELSMKVPMVEALADALRDIGKKVDIHYISEAMNAKV